MSTVFHSRPPPWLESVKDLKPGGKRRPADGVLVSFNGRAYHRWDFREKTSEVYEPQLTLAEKLAIDKAMREADDAAITSHTTPEGMHIPQDWPVLARAWLHKAGLSNGDIAELRALWSPAMQRVVIPITTLEGGKAWIARTLSKEPKGPPKYLFPSDFKRGGGVEWWPQTSAGSKPDGLVIVEDPLSAYRIARDTAWAGVAALGTSLDRDAVVSLAQRGAPVKVWLDPDFYGQQGARRIKADLGRLGVEAKNIVSDRDPKLYEPKELRRWLT